LTAKKAKSVWKSNMQKIKTRTYAWFAASGYELNAPANPHQMDLVPNSEPRRSARRIEADFDAKRTKLGVKDELKDIPGVTTQMLIAFGEHRIKSIENLADCATDDLYGWSESKDGETIRHAGILGRFRASRKECDAIIIYARIKAGWIE
jgi:hypothetical protein